MCPGGISRGGADAQWKQIGSIARADMPWSAVEWRLARQMNCTNAQHRPQKATEGRIQCFRQIIARADMPWSAVEWRLARQMNCTNAQHRPQKATGGRMLCLRQIIARGNVPWRCVQRGCRRSMETNWFHRATYIFLNH